MGHTCLALQELERERALLIEMTVGSGATAEGPWVGWYWIESDGSVIVRDQEEHALERQH